MEYQIDLKMLRVILNPGMLDSSNKAAYAGLLTDFLRYFAAQSAFGLFTYLDMASWQERMIISYLTHKKYVITFMNDATSKVMELPLHIPVLPMLIGEEPMNRIDAVDIDPISNRPSSEVVALILSPDHSQALC